MTFIAVRCPHCQSDQIIKRGKTARGTQRYLVAGAKFATAEIFRG
jgi:transposase-like protein